MKNLLSVNKILNGYDFYPVPNQKLGNSMEYFFENKSNKLQIRKYVSIRKLPRTGSIAFRFGFEQVNIRSLLKLLFSEQSFGVVPATELLSYEAYTCWTTFPINTNFSLNATSILNSDTALNEFNESTLKQFMNELIIPTITDGNLLDHYLKDNAPFCWGTASGVFGRICEIAVLCFLTDTNFDRAIECVNQQFKYLKADRYGCNAPDNIFEKILISLKS